ncbi:MAG: hypothetical protein IBX61_03900 [Thermoleophilia bacterium]|nr:hypothetical protein [Thermoleophilia bacterium]
MRFQRYKAPSPPPFDYTGLIKDTLGITWRRRYLWFFGLFAFGSVNNLSGFNAGFDLPPGSWFSEPGGLQPAGGGDELRDLISANLGLITAAVAAFFILAILIWLWSLVCRGAVIGAVADIRENMTSGFGSAFAHGRRSMGRLLLLDLLLLGIGIGFFIIFGAAGLLFIFLMLSGDAGQTIAITALTLAGLGLAGLLLTGLGYLTCFTIFIAIGFVVNVLLIYATRAIVLDGDRPISALRRGWRLMMDNLTRTILLFLLGTGLGIAAGIGAFMAIGAAAVPAIAAWVVTGAGGWHPAGIVMSVLLTFVPIAAGLLATALINTYFTTYWTIVWRRLSDREPVTAAALLRTNAIG